MLSLQLEHTGDGAFRAASRFDQDLCGKVPRGQRVWAKLSLPRSVRQNRFFHAVIEEAYENQRSGPRLPTWRHLKSWLLIRAGHCRVDRMDPACMTREMAALLREIYDDIDFSTDGKSLFVKTAKSLKFERVERDEMSEVVDRVVDLICEQIIPGTTPDDLRSRAMERALGR